MASVETVVRQAAMLRKNAKALLTFTLVTAAMTHCAQAQTFAEWFSQKKTQKKYLLQQIAALQVYSGYLQKGYRIAKGGLGSISGYVGNEFGMHSAYYNYQRSASIPVKNDPQVNEILRRQQDILSVTNQLKDQAGLNREEVSYVSKVSSALLNDCNAQLHDLEIVLADQKTMMSDEQRLRHIARIHDAMADNYRFVAGFANQLKIYASAREREIKNVNTLTHLYAKQ